MKNVVIRAPLLSRSGYGVHSRQIFHYLLQKENINLRTQIVPWGMTPWYTNPEECGGLAGEAMRRTSQPGESHDISFQVILPNEWDASLAKFNVGVTAGVETTLCNPEWCTEHCNKMNLVIVPSEHTKNAFMNSAPVQTDIRVVPESYFSELLEEPDDLNLGLETNFNFLTVGVLTGISPETDRKNLFYLIKWFLETFNQDPDVGLIVKTNRGRETTIDKRLTGQLLSDLLKELGHTGTPKVYLLHGDMSRKEMNSLYRDEKVKALVSATRGEGFGLPILEASVAGLPVIATNWSAHTEFMNRGKWIKVDYELRPIGAQRVDNAIFMDNSWWAYPKEESMKASLTKFRRKPEIPGQWAKELSQTLQKEYSIEAICQKYDDVLGNILM